MTSSQSPPMPEFEWSLYAGMGAYALLAQTILLRQFIVNFHGNEVSLALFFSCWFIGIVIGAATSGRYADRIVRPKRWRIYLILAGVFLPLLCLVAMKTLPAWFAAVPGQVPGWNRLLLAGLFAVPVGVWVGFAFPLFSRASDDSASAVGRLFVWEAVGALAGGLVLSLVLIPRVSPLGCMIMAAAVLICGYAASYPQRWSMLNLLFAGLLLLFSLSDSVEKLEQSLEKIRFSAIGTGAIFERSLETEYQNVLFAEAAEQKQIYINGEYIDSYPDPTVYREEAALLLAQREQTGSVLLLGGGLTGLAGELLASPQVRQLDIVVLDELYIRQLLARLPDSIEKTVKDPRVRLMYRDIRRYVREADKQYDLIVVAAPDPSTAMLNRFYTIEFFREVSLRLGNNGVLALSLTGADNLVGDIIGPYLGSIDRTLREVFPQTLILPGDRYHLFATPVPGALTSSPEIMKNHYRAAFDNDPPLPLAVIDQWVVPERIEDVRRELHGIPAEINRDLRPIAYLAFLRIWDQFAGGGLASWLTALVKLPRWLWWAMMSLFVVALALPILFSPVDKRKMRYGLLSVFSSGLIGMVATVMAAIAYQSLFGQMYQKVALLIALYMGGLAGGGWLTMRRMNNAKTNPLKLLLIGDAALAALGVLFIAYLHGGGLLAGWLSQTILFCLLAAIGAAAGAAFPAAAQVLADQGLAVGRRAGKVDAVDHLAAFLGALVLGVVLLPVMGLATLCGFWAVAKVVLIVASFRLAKRN